MPDYRAMFDRNYFSAFELNGKDATATIERVEAGKMPVRGSSKTERKPVVYFRGSPRGLALNKTNAKTIAAMYGNKTEDWIGKRITVFPTTTQFGSQTVECIRVRPKVPGTGTKNATLPNAPEPSETAPPALGGDEALPPDPLSGDDSGEVAGL